MYNALKLVYIYLRTIACFSAFDKKMFWQMLKSLWKHWVVGDKMYWLKTSAFSKKGWWNKNKNIFILLCLDNFVPSRAK